MWVVGPCASFASPAPGRTWIDRDAHARSTPRRRASPLRTPRRACTQRTQGAPRKQRTCLLLRRWVPAASLPGRGSSTGGGARLPRCARGVGCARARGAAPRAARGHWGLVRLLLSLGAARLLLPSCFAFSTRPDGGKTTIRPPTPPNAYPGTERLPGTTTRPRATPSHPATPRGLGPKSPQLRPNTVPSAHHHFAPPSRAARSRRPLAPSTRAARSRCPLAPPARAVRSRRSQPSPAPDPH